MTEIPFGQRLKSEKERIMFERFPGSRVTEILPPGRPSPPIDSYIFRDNGGYYQLRRPGDSNNLYMKDTPDLQVVPADAPDDSTVLGTAGAWLQSKFRNTYLEYTAQKGFVSDAIDETADDISSGFSSFTGGVLGLAGNLKWVAILAVPVLIIVLVLVLLITSKVK